MRKVDRYVLWALWALAGVDLVWFLASGLSMWALLWFFVLAAAALGWWGLRGEVTDRMRRNASLAVSGFWVVVLALMLAPFPVPAPPQYIVGEVHRFSELEHGFGRAFTGALGPQLAMHGMVYTPMEEIAGLGNYGTNPTFVTTYPMARVTFAGTGLMDMFRNGVSVGGDPVQLMKFPWTTWEGEHRPTKLGWNHGDILLGDVAGELGYEKAKYTPHENTLMIKAIAKWMGSVDATVAAIDPRFFYSHDFLSMGTPLDLKDVRELKYGIQVFTDQNWQRVHNDPGESWWSVAKSGQAYSTSAWIGIRLAQILRDMGYTAHEGHGGINYETIETPFSYYGGLGEYGRLSDVVVPSAGGLRFKSATVLTDFPLEPQMPGEGFGITRMCAHCDRCARACPVNSVPMGDMTVENGVQLWQVDKDKCVRFRAGNLNGNCCNECLRVCPYNKPSTPFHKLGNYIVRHSPLAPYLFGNVNGVGLEDWLDFDVSSDAGDFNRNRPARWIIEEKGYKMPLPYMIGRYIFTEEDRSTSEEWASGVGVEMGKVGLTYKGVEWGKVPPEFLDKDGRSRNVHWDIGFELPKGLPLPGKPLSKEEAAALLKEGKAFTGGSYHKDDNVFPPRDAKYEKGLVTYEQAVKMWAEEKPEPPVPPPAPVAEPAVAPPAAPAAEPAKAPEPAPAPKGKE